MSAAMAAIVDQAALWHVRQADMSADEWEQFVFWLEADAEHARVYDAIALQDALIAEAHFPDAPATPVAANDDERVFRRRWPLAGTAGAAIAAGAMAGAGRAVQSVAAGWHERGDRHS
jgi:transmembrane sensor